MTRPLASSARCLGLALGALSLALLSGCAPHEHVHVYGRVYDVSGPRRRPLEGAEVWAVGPGGEPLRRAARTDPAGDYEVELAPIEQEGGLGVLAPGYRAEWWPLGELTPAQRRSHTKRLTLRVVREDAERARPEQAGRPWEAAPR